MTSFTVHLQSGAAPVLVREAFSWGALLFGPLWLLAHRAWLAALGAFVVFAIAAAVPSPWRGIPVAAAMLLMGLVGRDLWRWSLARRGYSLAHVVVARNEDAAMLRLLDHRSDLVAVAGAREAVA